MIRRIVAYVRRKVYGKNQIAVTTTGRIDFTEFDIRAAYYRKLGATIGKKVRLIGDIDGVNPHLISIGDYTVLGKNSALLAHCPIKGGHPVTVGCFSYISYGALVLPGVTIGDFCIVGAGAVVTKFVPNEVIVVGNPARILRSITREERDSLEKILLEEKLFGWYRK